MARVPFPIHHTFGPLVTGEQVSLALRFQFQPWRWWSGVECELLRRELSRHFGASVSLFATGRGALLASLRALELKVGEEVIVQGFTCVAVPNAIHAAGGNAVFVDVDPQTLNLDCEKVQRAITLRTRAIICQHTFGIPADTVRLRAICDKRGILLIEDCAHAIPAAQDMGQLSLFHPSPVGRHAAARNPSKGGIGLVGDILILSFGRDKAISGVTGGAALTRHPALARCLEESEQRARPLSPVLLMNLLGYPLRYALAKHLWNMPGPLQVGPLLAKAYLRFVQLLHVLPQVYERGEKEGKVGLELHALPNACATLALQQLQSLSSLNEHRRMITALYLQAAKESGWHVPEGATAAPALLKFPLYVQNPDRIRQSLRREQIYLDDGWSGAVVNPRDCLQEAAGYARGSCPRAEEVARHILTLPTHPTMTEAQAKYVVSALRSALGL